MAHQPSSHDAGIAAVTWGPVLFLHSGVGGAGEWRAVVDAWPTADRCIAIRAHRPRGTLDVRTDLTMDDYAQQVVATAEELGEPVHLVGLSWGGATALRVAATRPDLLASLAVVEPQAYPLLRDFDHEAYATAVHLRDRWRRRVAVGDITGAFRGFLDHFYGQGSFDSWPEERRDALLRVQRQTPDLWDVLFDSPTTVDDLCNITLPTLVIQGGRTAALERRLCDVVVEHVPGARRTVVPGAGHLVPLTHPAEVVESLAAHLDRSIKNVRTDKRSIG